MNSSDTTESPSELYNDLINRLITYLCEQLSSVILEGKLDPKRTHQWTNKISRLYKYMRIIEKTTENPRDIGLFQYHSAPVLQLLRNIEEKQNTKTEAVTQVPHKTKEELFSFTVKAFPVGKSTKLAPLKDIDFDTKSPLHKKQRNIQYLSVTPHYNRPAHKSNLDMYKEAMVGHNKTSKGKHYAKKPLILGKNAETLLSLTLGTTHANSRNYAKRRSKSQLKMELLRANTGQLNKTGYFTQGRGESSKSNVSATIIKTIEWKENANVFDSTQIRDHINKYNNYSPFNYEQIV